MSLRSFFDGSYIKRRFFVGVGAILAGTVGLEFVVFVNTAVGGFVLGSSSIAAFGVVLPVFFVQTAVMRIFLDGILVLGPRSYGVGDRARADRVFGTAVVAEAIVIAVVGVLTYALRPILLNAISGGIGSSMPLVESYYDWTIPMSLAASMRLTLERLAIVEGRMKLVYLNAVVFVVLDLLGVCVLVKPLGVSGLCLAQSFSALCAALVVVVGFIIRKVSFRIRLALAWEDVCGLITFGLPKMFGRLGDAFVIFLLNAYVMRNFGVDWLAYVHFVKNSRKFLTAFPDAFDNASTPIVCAQIGARNWRGVINTMKLACTVTPLVGLVATVVTMVGADVLAAWCGFSGEDAVTAAFSMRWGTVMIASYFLKDILCAYYVALGNIRLPSVIRFLSRGLLTLSLGACCVEWLDGDGAMFLRMIAVSDFAILAFLVVLGIIDRPSDTTPILNIPTDELRRQAVFDVVIAPDQIGPLRERVGKWLAQFTSSRKIILRAQLLIEETMAELALRTKGRRHLLECFVFAPNGMNGGTIQFSDTLSLSDHTNPDETPVSQSDALSRMVLSSFAGARDYNPVIGSNRVVYTLVPTASCAYRYNISRVVTRPEL